PNSLTERLGPHFRGDERRGSSVQHDRSGRTRIHLFNCQTAMRSRPRTWLRARGGPSLFRLPNEGSGAPRRRMVWISPDRPDLTGGPGSPGPWRTSRVRPRPLDAPRGITAFAFTASRTEPAVFVPRGGFPSAARGRGLRLPRSRVPHPAPPSRRLATTPLDGRDARNLR